MSTSDIDTLAVLTLFKWREWLTIVVSRQTGRKGRVESRK